MRSYIRARVGPIQRAEMSYQFLASDLKKMKNHRFWSQIKGRGFKGRATNLTRNFNEECTHAGIMHVKVRFQFIITFSNLGHRLALKKAAKQNCTT